MAGNDIKMMLRISLIGDEKVMGDFLLIVVTCRDLFPGVPHYSNSDKWYTSIVGIAVV